MKPYYEHAGQTIYCADCREILPGLHADLVIADPPYGMKKAVWDAEIVPVDSWLDSARRIAPALVFTGIKGMWDYPKPDWVMSWVRVGSTQRNGSLRGFNNWEPILVYGLQALSNDTIEAANIPDGDTGDHPTPKPLKLMDKLLARVPGAVVVDPFCGTGTTLISAKNLGRKAIGIEIEEKYCEIAAKRLSQEVFDFTPTP